MDEPKLTAELNELIVKYMPVAEVIGSKYASRNGHHKDESIAEAYYLLCMFFLSNTYKLFGVEAILLRKFLYRGLIEYFKGRSKFRRSIKAISFDRMIVDKYSVQGHVDAEMLEYLSGLLADDEVATQVLGYLRVGLTFDEIEYLEEKIKKASVGIYKLIAKRLKNLHQMKVAGIPVKRSLIPEPKEEPNNSDIPPTA